MRRKQRSRSGVLLQMFHHRPRDRQSIKRRSTSTTSSSSTRLTDRVMQNRRHLAHLHRKCGTPARQIIAGSNPRENPVRHRQFRLSRRHEAPHLSHQHNQRGLPQISRLASHIRPGDQQQLLPLRFRYKSFGTKRSPRCRSNSSIAGCRPSTISNSPVTLNSGLQ